MSKTAAAKKASGRNISEAERGTERINLRLKPSVMALLESLASEVGPGKDGQTDDMKKYYAKTIEMALHALSRELDAEVEEDNG